MAEREVTVRLRAEIDSYVQGLSRAKSATSEFGRELTGQGKSSREEIERVGRSALVMATVLSGGLALSAKAAVDWESSFAGVTKTVDGTAAQIANLEAGLRDMAKELPATHGEIAAVAEAAGQLGVKVGDVESFTRTMVDLGETTNLSATEAATSIARMTNIMGTAPADVERLGSTLVDLGNNAETTEAEILELATRMAAAGKIAGLSEADVLAFASTLSSVGVEAEAGGTALSKVFISMRDAVLTGSEQLDTFAAVAGVSAESFASAFRDDAAEAISMFVSGLGAINESGRSTTGVLEDLELTDQRLMRALLSTASAGDLLNDQLGRAGDAWEANNALQTEAEKRYATTGAQLEMLRNQAVDLGIDLGTVLLPALNAGAGGAGTLATGLSELPGPLQAVGVGIAGIGAVGLGTIGVIGTFGPKVRDVQKTLAGMGSTAQFVGRNMGRMAVGLGAAGIALGIISKIAGDQAQRAAEAEAQVRSWADAIRDAGGAAKGAAVYLRQLVDDTPDLAIAMQAAGVNAKDLTAAVNAGGTEFETMAQRIVAGGRASGISGKALLDLVDIVGSLEGKAGDAEAVAEALNDVLGDTTGADSASAAIDAVGDSADTAADKLAALVDAYRAPLEPIFAMQDAIAAVADAERNVANARRAHSSAQREAVEAAAAVEDAQIAVAQAMSIAADETEAARRGIQNLANEQRAAVDPLFAMVNALQKLEDLRAQGGSRTKVTRTGEDSGYISSEQGDEPSAIDFASAAADVQGAATRLSGAILTGDVSLEGSREILRQWVAQGLLTQAQADEVGAAFEAAAIQAEGLQGATVQSAAAAEVAAENMRVERERAEAVAEAQERVADASERAADAQERVADAADDVASASDGAARRALDLMSAAINLTGAMEINADTVKDAKDRIQEFADKGLVSQQQADRLKDSIDDVTEAALRYTGEYEATLILHADMEKFWEEVAKARAALSEKQVQRQIDNPYLSTPGFQLAAGGILSYAAGGMSGAHIARNQVVKYAEPQTGGEAYIPRYGDTSRSLGILQTAAGWFGASVSTGGGGDAPPVNVTVNYPKPEPMSSAVPRTIRKAMLARGG